MAFDYYSTAFSFIKIIGKWVEIARDEFRDYLQAWFSSVLLANVCKRSPVSRFKAIVDGFVEDA